MLTWQTAATIGGRPATPTSERKGAGGPEPIKCLTFSSVHFNGEMKQFGVPTMVAGGWGVASTPTCRLSAHLTILRCIHLGDRRRQRNPQPEFPFTRFTCCCINKLNADFHFRTCDVYEGNGEPSRPIQPSELGSISPTSSAVRSAREIVACS